MKTALSLGAVFLASLLAAGEAEAACTPSPTQRCYFEIQVVKWYLGQQVPVGCVTLRTVADVDYVSDANGIVAFYEPGLMDQTNVWFWAQRRGFAGGDFDGPNQTPTGFGGGKLLPVSEGGVGSIEVVQVPPSNGAAVCDPGVRHTTVVSQGVPDASELFTIQVVDPATDCEPVGCGLPTMEITTESGTFWTDSNGLVAAYFDPSVNPELSGPPPWSVFFEIRGEGYAYTGPDTGPQGQNGIYLQVSPGGTETIEVERLDIAERRYRMDGIGIYRDSELAGVPSPLAKPVNDANVVGNDRPDATVFNGELFWMWGDAIKPSGAGVNRGVVATSALPGAGGLDPDDGVDLTYFENAAGAAKEMLTNGPKVWPTGMVTVLDSGGAERLYTSYVESFGTGASGFSLFDEQTELFNSVLVFTGNENVLGHGRFGATRQVTGGTKYVYWPNAIRHEATDSALLDATQHEAFTAVDPADHTKVTRDVEGNIIYDWRANTPLVNRGGTTHLPLGPEHLSGHWQDPETGYQPFLSKPSKTYNSQPWNPYRRRYGGAHSSADSSTLQSTATYIEADTPVGPYVYTREIVRSNVFLQHHINVPALYQDAGRRIFFALRYGGIGAASGFPSGNPFGESGGGTDWYDYTTLMYKLDLEDPRLFLPVPVYDLSSVPGDLVTKDGLRPSTPDDRAPFFAPDRHDPSYTLPIHWSTASCNRRALVAGGEPKTQPVFYALDGGATPPPSGTTTPLYEYVHLKGTLAYSIESALVGYTQTPTPIAQVWTNPIDVTFPVSDYLTPLIADAGHDLCVHTPTAGAGVTVGLDATASSHATAGESIASYAWYTWSWASGTSSQPIATGATPNVTLGETGTHVIELIATDTLGETRTDSVVIEVAAPVDTDGDGISDFHDNCIEVANADQRDADADGFGTACDPDYDDDGEVDLDDADMFALEFGGSNPEFDHDGDGIVGFTDWGTLGAYQHARPGPSGLGCAGSAPCLDADGDGVPNAEDNCVEIAGTQTDSDADGAGDVCDGDINQDGLVWFDDLNDLALCTQQSHAGALPCTGCGPTHDPGCTESDMNSDGVVDDVDAALFQNAGNRAAQASPPYSQPPEISGLPCFTVPAVDDQCAGYYGAP